MPTCCVPSCRSGYKSEDSQADVHLTFHKFPEDEDRRYAWLRAIRREGFIPSVSSRVCSLHFQDSDFIAESMDSNPYRKRKEKELKRRYLRNGVIPSRFVLTCINVTPDPVIILKDFHQTPLIDNSKINKQALDVESMKESRRRRMPTTREQAVTKVNEDVGQITMNGPSEVIDVSDNETAEPEVVVNNSAEPDHSATVDLTENIENGSNSDSILVRNSEKENGSRETKANDDEVNANADSKGKTKDRKSSKQSSEEREPEIEINQDHEVDGKTDDDGEENSDDNGLSIAATRSKRSTVRRPVRHGDFDFDYADSSEYEEGSEEEEEEGNGGAGDATRSREVRSLRLDRQRSTRGFQPSGPTEDGENEMEIPPKGKLERNRKNRKRSSNIDSQSGMKRRKRNQPVQIEDLDDETPSNGLEEVHMNSAAGDETNRSENAVEGSRDSVRSVPMDVEALSEVDSNVATQRAERGPPSGDSPSGDDSDLFCWVCHKYGKVICCETCVRVYHMRCLNLNSEPSDDWFCPECADIVVDAQRSSGLLDPTGEEDMSAHTRIPITKKELAPLLLHAIDVMRMLPSSEPFHEPVDTNDVKDYDSYIVNPMSLSKLEENVHGMKYSSTGGFMSDARWILHNCIVYNGPNNPLTSISRQILKRCRIEMREIVACPDCYRFQMEANNGNKTSSSNDNAVHWFSKVCRIPHPIVWVRLRNYPVWPAKVIEEVQVKDEFRVRTKFFGAHDYAEVPFSCATFHTRSRSTSVDSRNLHVEHYKLAFDELQEHERLLRQRYADFTLPAAALKYIPEIANNTYRLLGSRQKRLVSATIRAEGSGSVISNSSQGSDNGHGPGGGIISSRRSSNDSVSSSVFAGGSSVHMYRAKPISDMKTRLVSVPISGPNSNATSTCAEEVSSTAGDAGGADNENGQLEEAINADSTSAKKKNCKEQILSVVDEEMENESSKSTSNQSAAGTLRSSGRRSATQDHPPESCNGAEVAEEDQLMDVDETTAPYRMSSRSQVRGDKGRRISFKCPAVSTRDPVSSEDKATYTEDLDDIMHSLNATDSSDRDFLSMNARDLLSCIRWSCQGGSRLGSSSKDREETEKTEGDSQELSKLRQENGQLRRCVTALEEQLELVKSKHSREVKMNEDRLALLYELKLLEQRHNFDLCLAETRHSYDNDRVKVVHETRRLLHEDVKKIVSEVKGKQWCAYCRNEAFYYCCWNTSYCDANCQKKHWTTHMGSCAQTNQQNADAGRGQMARAPNPQQAALNAQHANQTNMAAQMIPGRRMMASMPQINQR